jgi:hypothetical protein
MKEDGVSSVAPKVSSGSPKVFVVAMRSIARECSPPQEFKEAKWFALQAKGWSEW